jgi:MSHA biogenesis protein MshO
MPLPHRPIINRPLALASQTITHQQKGFTLIEMVVTIVIVGILGVGIANFVGRTTQGMADIAERQQLATIGWLVSEKVSRALRQALPNSVRMDGSNRCVEFIPTIAGSDYLAFSILSDVSSFESVRFRHYAAGDVDTSLDRVAIYPNSATDLYKLPNPGIISGLVSQISAGSSAGAVTVSLAASHRFIADSPTDRVYIVQNPVMYCFDSGFLYRYSDYGYHDTFASGTTLQNETVIGSRLRAGTFTYTAGVLTRNAIVTMRFIARGDNGATQTINQEVQIRNVP